MEAYALQHSQPEDPALADLARWTRQHAERPSMLSGPLVAGMLRLLAQISGARRVLEVGTFTGYGTLHLAAGLPPDGEVISLEANLELASAARARFGLFDHGHKIEVVVGPALETMPRLVGPFDLIFVDADKANYPAYLELSLGLLRPGGLLVFDNTFWYGRVLDPDANDADTLGIRELNRRICADPCLENLFLPIRDGLQVARFSPHPSIPG